MDDAATLTTRCSSLPLQHACPASAHAPPGEPRLKTNDSAATLGSAFHRAIASAVLADRMDADTIDEAAAVYGVDDRPELARLCWTGWRLWDTSLRRWFPEPRVEVEMRGTAHGLTLSGHADVLSQADREARVLDWKTGWADDGDPAPQVRGYAWLAMAGYGLVRARTWTVRVREQVADCDVLTWRQADDALRLVAERLRQADAYNPGPHCRWCPRALHCPALRQTLALSVEMLGYVVDEVVLPEEADKMLDVVRLVELACERARAGLKALVASHGGALPLKSGRELALDRQTQHPIVVTPDSMAIVAAECASDPDYCATLRFTKSAVEKAVKDNAPHGQKAAAWRQTLARLEEAGCLGETTTERLVVRRALPLINQET